MKCKVPKEVKEIARRLKKAKAKGYIVGGYVRDRIMGVTPSDIDVFTSLKPKEIKRLFPKGKEIGTTERHKKIYTIIYKGVEISSFRKSGDRRKIGRKLKKHISTCDFTVNSIAMDISNGQIIDRRGGIKDIKKNILKFVGNPEVRIEEDPLRMLRAIRFVSTRGFNLNPSLLTSVRKKGYLIKTISPERIQDEFNKILMGDDVEKAFIYFQLSGLPLYLFPEFVLCINHYCGKHHKFYVGQHTIKAISFSPKDLAIRLALFFHDQGKPPTFDGEHFFGHERVSAEIAKKRLSQYKYPKKMTKEVIALVKNHMFISKYYEDGQRYTISDSSIRRLVKKLGSRELMYKLLDVRDADRYGNSFKEPDKELRKKVDEFFKKEYALKVTDLKINGKDVMDVFNIGPSKKVGVVLNYLFEEVYDNPKLNTVDYLMERLRVIKRNEDMVKKNKED